MKIGLFTDGLMHLGFTEALAKGAISGCKPLRSEPATSPRRRTAIWTIVDQFGGAR
jgi:hypothetical protein